MKILTLALILISFSGLSQARSWNQNRYNDYSRHNNNDYFWQDIEKRRHNQYSHIDYGIEKGQLTRREIKRLKRERKHLAKEIKHYRRRNYLSHSDKRNILGRLKHYSDQIYNLKHNNYYSRRNRHNHQQYARHDNYRYSRHNKQYVQHDDYRDSRHNKKHAKYGRISQSSRNNHKYYRNNGFLSHSNRNFSSGFYFRF